MTATSPVDSAVAKAGLSPSVEIVSMAGVRLPSALIPKDCKAPAEFSLTALDTRMSKRVLDMIKRSDCSL